MFILLNPVQSSKNSAEFSRIYFISCLPSPIGSSALEQEAAGDLGEWEFAHRLTLLIISPSSSTTTQTRQAEEVSGREAIGGTNSLEEIARRSACWTRRARRRGACVPVETRLLASAKNDRRSTVSGLKPAVHGGHVVKDNFGTSIRANILNGKFLGSST